MSTVDMNTMVENTVADLKMMIAEARREAIALEARQMAEMVQRDIQLEALECESERLDKELSELETQLAK